MERDKKSANTNWENVTYEELMELYVEKNYIDAMVADLYGVTRSKVAYKRKKLGITRADIIYKRIMSGQDSQAFSDLQNLAKNDLVNTDISIISRAIVHYAFRNGPVEIMHTEGKLSENDMMILNKYMNNKIATILTLLKNQDWLRLLVPIVSIHGSYGEKWDEPEICIEELDKIMKRKLKP